MTGADGRRPIVVGVDPDPEKRLALSWAADEAQRRRLPLRLVHAQGTPTGGYRSGEVRPSWEEWNRELHGLGDRVLRDAVSFVETRQPTVELSTLLAEGEPAWILHEETRNASLVVVGSWHLSRRRTLFSAPSVALPLAAHAACPVVVVPEPEHVTQQPAYFVVGVDGSEHSAEAVNLAMEEAALRGANLRALYVWHPPLLGLLDEHAALGECRRVLAETVAGRTEAHPDVELHHEVVRGHPVDVLTQASEHALGLVVGSRGRGGFTGMVLGSVSQGVLHHARCPVITVPA
ncbi:universal stress protein [Streptomyces griseoincarnatus]|uniref:Universal stress protein n=1 Tax=Streptomyces variabilis TaxID=67372 RepID=A0ABQ2TWQ0_9ACTN|nr:MULTISPECIES: universal stress protein [Streptomyces]MDH3034187.1 universal stress protein [Streptomyces sp. TRM75561]MQL61652.1 universal stress protein [Streptomyces vinaceus]GGP64440.1 universal stress protein [Streptomyces griseoincarnatus]GGT50472.1 universal stress protein [Streptomyces variabilis]